MATQAKTAQVLLVKDYCLRKDWDFYEYSKPQRLLFLEKNLEDVNAGQLKVILYGQAHVYLACMYNVNVFSGRFIHNDEDNSFFLHGLTHSNMTKNINNRLKEGGFLSVGSDESSQLKVNEPNIVLESEAILIGGNSNFGHWIFEHVFRLTTLDLHPHLKSLKLLITKDVPARFLEFLYLLGYKKEQLCLIDYTDTVRVPKLWVPSVTYYMGHYSDAQIYVSPEAIHKLRYSFLQERSLLTTHHLTKKLRVYVSRRKAKWRRLLNETQVIEFLLQYGFQVVYLEEMSPKEQLDLASQTEILVMPIGGGSMVSMFLPKDAFIVDLMYKRFYSQLTSINFAHVLGQYYHRIDGNPVSVPDERKGTVTEPFDYDFEISLVDLSDALQKIGKIIRSGLSFSQELYNNLFGQKK